MENAKLLVWRGRFIRYAPVLLWTAVIFFLSSNSGSMSETSRFIGPVLKYLFPDITAETLQLVHLSVRKFAHFAEYAILAFLVVRAFSRSTHEILRRLRFVLPLLFVSLIAATDEFNQSFIETRSGSGWDSLLDIAGGLAMIVTLWIIGWPKVNVVSERK